MPAAFVYVISNKIIATDLWRRFQEHLSGKYPNGFTARYRFTKLVYYETALDLKQAAAREKEIKAWRREKKVKLIQAMNPNWLDLSSRLDPMRFLE